MTRLSTSSWRGWWLSWALAGLLLAAAAGCDTAFDAYEETDLYYSVFGYLDAEADTQWVRVERLQDSVFVGGGDRFEGTVALEPAGGGAPVALEHVPATLATGTILNNFRAVGDVAYDTRYLLVVRGGDGVQTTAEAHVPTDFPQPSIEGEIDQTCRPGEVNPCDVLEVGVEEVDRLGAVLMRYQLRLCVTDPGGRITCDDVDRRTSHLTDTSRVGGRYVVLIDWREALHDLCPSNASCRVLDAEVIVASVSADWPAYAAPIVTAGGITGSDETLPPPGTDTNVTNGVGFLGGAVIKRVPVPVVD